MEPQMSGSDDPNAVGNVESVKVLSQVHIGLLLAIRPDEGVYLGALNIIHGLDSLLDFLLGGLDVNNEDEGIDLLDFLHGRLCGQRVFDDRILIQLCQALHRFPWILALTLLDKGLGQEEVHILSLLGCLTSQSLLQTLRHLRRLLAALLCLDGLLASASLLGCHVCRDVVCKYALTMIVRLEP